MHSWKLCAKYECLERERSFSENSYFFRSGLYVYFRNICIQQISMHFQCKILAALHQFLVRLKPLVRTKNTHSTSQTEPIVKPKMVAMHRIRFKWPILHWKCTEFVHVNIPYYLTILSDLVCINLYQFMIISIAALIYILSH